MNHLVIIQNRQVVTSSIQIAESFEKQHPHVLRDIDGLQKDVSNFGEMFFETETLDSYGRSRRAYLMNRDGFTLLAMGFTGSKALDFKLKYIKAFNEMERQLTQPTTAELIAMMAQQGVEQERRLNQVELKTAQLEAKQENIAEIVALNPTEWRKKTTTILNKIALARGGFEEYRKVRNESYQVLDERARCKLDIRLNNRKKEMAINGATRTQLEKVSKLDVIANDARLTEIYLAIVKEMAIKHQINVEGLGA
ncbi:Rha family transcriptional regulator [Lysinibacillus fusiformis]